MQTAMMKKSLLSATTALALATSLNAATVTILTDENDFCASGAGCSLREAINETAVGGTIDFAVSGALELTSPVMVYNDVTINGASGISFIPSGGIFIIGDGSVNMPTVNINNLTINDANNSVALLVYNGSTLNLSNTSVINNIGDGTGGAAIKGDGFITADHCTFSGNNAGISLGAAFYSYGGSVTITNSVIENNTADSGGAFAFYNGTAISITDSNISYNSATTGGGGAFYGWGAGSLAIAKSHLSLNTASTSGGAIYTSGVNLMMSDSTVEGSSASSTGGGLYIDIGSANIINSTISGNVGVDGGGIATGSTADVNISHSTIAYNTVTGGASGGGGILNYSANVNLKSSVLAYNDGLSGGPDCAGSITSYDYNLISSTAQCTVGGTTTNSFLDVDPLLLTLGDNGGPTPTYYMDAASSLINGGSPTDLSGASVLYDQRGVARSLTTPTIGAVEYVPDPATISLSTTSIDFGYIPSGGYAEQIVTIYNGGPSAYNLSSVSFMYGSPEYSVDSSACGSSLAAGATCDILVGVSPAAADTDYYDQLIITGDDIVGTQYVDIYANSWSSQYLNIEAFNYDELPMVGKSMQLTAWYDDGVTYSDVTGSVTWSSDNTAVATVSSSGLLTGVSEGSFNLSVTYNGITTSRLMYVNSIANASPATIGGSYTGGQLIEGQMAFYSVTLSETGNLFLDATSTGDSFLRLYDSNMNLIGSNDDSGGTLNSSLAHLLNAGTYYVGVSGCCDQILPDYTLSVAFTAGTTPVLYSVDFYGYVIGLNEEHQLSLWAYYSDGSTQMVTTEAVWSSDTPSVISVTSSGYMTAQGVLGSANISAVYNGVTYTALFDVGDYTVVNPTDITDQTTCETNGYYWTGSTCTFYQDYPEMYTDQTTCESAGYYWTGTYCTYPDGASGSDFRIDFGRDITAAEYAAAVALDPSFLANTEMYMLSYESYSGYNTEKFSIAGTTDYTWTINKFNPTTLAYDTLSESLVFTKGTDNVLSSTEFDIKYIGTQSAGDVNSTIFSTLGSAHRFVYSQKVDSYDLYDQQTNYMDMTTYTSLEAFMLDFSTGYSYFEHKEGTYDTGLAFAYSSGATSGNLVEVQYGIISNTNAGTWEIINVTGIGSVLIAHPSDTAAYRDNMIWAMQTDGYLYRGELQAVGTGFNFYLFDQAAHDEFVQYIASTYGVTVPVVGFNVTELVGQTFYYVAADGSYGVMTYNNDGTTLQLTSGSFVADSAAPTQTYAVNSSGQLVIGGTTTVTLVSKTADYAEVQVSSGGSQYLQRIFTNPDFAQSYLDSITVVDTTLKLTFASGWNLVSLPAKAHLGSFDLELYFGALSGSVDFLAKYGVAGWSYYLVDTVDPTVSRFTTLSSGEGFWLRATSAGEVVFSFTEDTAYADEVWPLHSGWNLVGVNRNMTAAELKALYDAYAVETMWIYNGAWKVFTGYDLDVIDESGAVVPKFTDVSRTDGVWIKVK